jgi:hypothetical protein
MIEILQINRPSEFESITLKGVSVSFYVCQKCAWMAETPLELIWPTGRSFYKPFMPIQIGGLLHYYHWPISFCPKSSSLSSKSSEATSRVSLCFLPSIFVGCFCWGLIYFQQLAENTNQRCTSTLFMLMSLFSWLGCFNICWYFHCLLLRVSLSGVINKTFKYLLIIMVSENEIEDYW